MPVLTYREFMPPIPPPVPEASDSNASQAMLREEFHRIADERYARLVATGKTIPWESVRDRLLRFCAADSSPSAKREEGRL
ncbi:hypothetical protein [Solimonas sp. K1W22B-7]|uniref:hypothetical protein n=1 Tax=Solimonas sp. K1W22B-7 TaxID=2303331 RepID=UPI0013C51522|nr:hypothetical protein [Solimonas sp. K1W22B-7]